MTIGNGTDNRTDNNDNDYHDDDNDDDDKPSRSRHHAITLDSLDDCLDGCPQWPLRLLGP
jgi:hypothetical protein